MGKKYDIRDRTAEVRDAILKIIGEEIDPKNVSADQLSDINSLELRNFGIERLKEGDFEGLTGLIFLGLDSNKLEELPEGIFSDLINLKNLDLKNNRIEALPRGIFEKVVDLVKLDLSNNLIKKFPANIFDSLENLTFLSFADNKLKDFEKGEENKLFKRLSGCIIVGIDNDQSLGVKKTEYGASIGVGV